MGYIWSLTFPLVNQTEPIRTVLKKKTGWHYDNRRVCFIWSAYNETCVLAAFLNQGSVGRSVGQSPWWCPAGVRPAADTLPRLPQPRSSWAEKLLALSPSSPRMARADSRAAEPTRPVTRQLRRWARLTQECDGHISCLPSCLPVSLLPRTDPLWTLPSH